MSGSGSELGAAEARAVVARSRLNSTIETLQGELIPERLARKAITGIGARGEVAVRRSAAAARRNPALVAGATGLLLAVLARKRIARLVSRNRDRG